MGKVILYIGCSLDGYIATEDDNLDFLDVAADEGEDYGYYKFYNEIGTVILGRRTFDKVLQLTAGVNPHAGKELYVLSRDKNQSFPGVNFYHGEITELITELKNNSDKHIYCDGGSQVIELMMNENLIDELIISIVPVLIGKGIRLFRNGIKQTHLQLIETRHYPKGMVQLHYQVKK